MINKCDDNFIYLLESIESMFGDPSFDELYRMCISFKYFSLNNVQWIISIQYFRSALDD